MDGGLADAELSASNLRPIGVAAKPFPQGNGARRRGTTQSGEGN